MNENLCPDKTVFNYATDWMYDLRRKHGLNELYVEEQVNDLSQFEFLIMISDAIEERIAGCE